MSQAGLFRGSSESLAGLDDQVASRIQALDRAQAPLDQLFDFVPDDTTNWVFVQEEWNNTWLGECAFHKYPAVDLMVLNNTSVMYQDVLPGLGTLLPTWATLDPSKQGYANIPGFLPRANKRKLPLEHAVTA